MQIGNVGVEQEIVFDDDLPFVVEKNDVAPGDSHTPAYELEGQDGYVLFIPEGVLFAPDFYDANGDPIDGSTRIILQKCNKQGDPLGNGICLNELYSKWNLEKMRNDPDFMRGTSKSLMLDERERAKLFLEIPEGAEAFSAAKSRITIGDTTSDFGSAVEVLDHDDLTPEEKAAVKTASQNGGR